MNYMKEFLMKMTNGMYVFIAASVIFSNGAFAQSNCKFPDYCYTDNGTLKTEESPEDNPDTVVNGEIVPAVPKPLPECMEVKVCPDYCKDTAAINDKDGNFTGKYKTVCMSDSRIKLESKVAKAAADYEKTKPERDAAERKRQEQFSAGIAKSQAEQQKKTKAAITLVSNPKKFAQCICGFGGCLGKRTPHCASLMSCREISADNYATAIGNREPLMVWNSHAYCVNPTAGFMRGD